MRGVTFIFFWLVSGFACGAEPCPGNPAALGTSRIITISPSEFSRIGSLQYKQTLPLNDHEVVITFDDGPIPPYSNIILDTLAVQCVKATYFLVGEMAHSHPSIVRRIYNAGHSIGSHSQNHPFKFQRLSMDAVEHEVDDGIASIDMALGDPKALSPFFRIPGFGRTDAIDDYLASKALVTWSTDIVADDWKRIGAREIVSSRDAPFGSKRARHFIVTRHSSGDRAGAAGSIKRAERSWLPCGPCCGGRRSSRIYPGCASNCRQC